MIILVFVLWAAHQSWQLSVLKAHAAAIRAQAAELQSQQATFPDYIAREFAAQQDRLQAQINAQQSEPDAWQPNPDIPLSAELQRYAEQQAARIPMDVKVLYNLIYRESRFDADAYCIDSNGLESVGLCQINGSTYGFLQARGIDTSKLSDPYVNIMAACTLIDYYKNDCGYTLLESLSAYGSGTGGMYGDKSMQAAKELFE